jgi:hypothetical protein
VRNHCPAKMFETLSVFQMNKYVKPSDETSQRIVMVWYSDSLCVETTVQCNDRMMGLQFLEVISLFEWINKCMKNINNIYRLWMLKKDSITYYYKKPLIKSNNKVLLLSYIDDTWGNYDVNIGRFLCLAYTIIWTLRLISWNYSKIDEEILKLDRCCFEFLIKQVFDCNTWLM